MIPGRTYSPDEILRSVLWRRKWLIVVTFVVVSTATIVGSSWLPDRFRADTVIVVVPQGVSPDFVRATVTPPIRDRLPTISAQILSRTRLEQIIHDLNLYAEARRTEPMQAVVDKMRDYIQVESVEASQSFRVSYEAESPQLAMRVTERLAGLFIEETSRDRMELAQATSEFLKRQLEDARSRLVEQEKRLDAYRQLHGPELPTQLQWNMQVAQNIQAQIQTLEDSLNRDRDRRLLVERRLADLQSEQLVGAQGAAADSRSQGSSVTAQLETALANLRALELRLTPEHPDLVRTRELVAELRRKAEPEATPRSMADIVAKPLTVSEATTRNQVVELRAELQNLDQLITDKLAQVPKLRAVLQTYQRRIEAAPARESELASLTRDYETLQNAYKTLLAKNQDSKIAENLERGQVDERFRILDRARLPESPFRPNRLWIDMVGVLGGLALGIAMAALLEFRDKSLKVEADVRAALALPVLVFVPAMPSPAERSRARRRQVGGWVALVTGLAMCATAMWFTFRV